MKKIFLFCAGLFLLNAGLTDVKAADGDANKLKGRWIVSIPDAPSGYQNFRCAIRETDKVLYADIRGGNNIDLKAQKLTEKDGKFVANVYVGENVTVTLWIENDTVKGTADTSQGKLNCIFSKPQHKSSKTRRAR